MPGFPAARIRPHGVQPRSTGWREVQLETRLVLQSLLDVRRSVSLVVAQVGMQVKRRGRSAVDLLQKRQKLLGPVALAMRPMT